MHNRWSRWCGGCIPKRIIIFVKCENYTLMQELICFSPFVYHYIDSSVFLEVARRGGLQPPTPPKSTTAASRALILLEGHFSQSTTMFTWLFRNIEILQQLLCKVPGLPISICFKGANFLIEGCLIQSAVFHRFELCIYYNCTVRVGIQWLLGSIVVYMYI